MAAVTFSQTFFAPGGGVAASCKAYVYVRGTTTPKQSFTSVDLSTPTTNPVIGSGVGVLLFYLDGDEDYSLTIKTSDDATTLMQVDYVAAGGFFSIISYTIENVQFAEFPFTGDGAETEYTLSNVLAPSVHSLWIALDGVYQPVSTYSVTRDSTDTHVTFGTAPANNADITIRLMALQGQRGDDGDSAYEVAVNNGFVGTEPEWLETLIGTSSRDEQVFSGDASDTTFVFTGMVITDKLNIMIFVDGIVQREADYSLSNNGTDTTITFDTAPPLGTNNIFMRGAVLTGGGAGTGDVVGPASVTDGRFALFDTTSGKLIKQHTGAPGALAVKNTVATADIDNDAVTFDKLLNATAAGFIGATGSGNFSERTPAQVTAALDAVVGDSGAGGTKGLVPAPGTGDAAASKFLKADGTWAVPSGGGGSGDVVGPASSTTNHVVGFADTTGKLIKALTAAQIRGAAALDSIDSPEFAGINVGHASDTTITRVSAGVIAVEGVTIPTASSTTTFTNKTLTSPVINTPTGIVKGDVGLGNVDNTSNATERAASATLTNKTLTTPTINGAALSGTLSGAPTLSGLITFSAGADMTPAATPSTTAVGYLGAPQRSISAADTFVMSDAGKHLYHPAADTTARAWTIPANASVAYPISTVIVIVNENAAGVITLAITSDTLRWGSSTGSRTLAANSTATLLKVTSTLWRLTGDGIT